MTKYAYEIHFSHDNIHAIFKTDDMEEALQFACNCEEEGCCFDFIDCRTGEIVWCSMCGRNLYITQEMRLMYAEFKALQD